MTAALVPELYVTDLDASLAFYCGLLGFGVHYQREEERFAYLKRGGTELMLEEPGERTWLASLLERPYGRGVNFQIMVDDVSALYAACLSAGANIYMPLETRSYRRRDEMLSQTQFLVQDPDGYLIRLAEIREPTV